MRGHALDSNNDMIIGDHGSMIIAEGGDEVVQHCRSRLLAYVDEWFLDLASGTPWFQSVFVKPVDLASVESILKSRILQTPGVAKLERFAMSYTGGGERKLSVAFEAYTTDDQPISFDEWIEL